MGCSEENERPTFLHRLLGKHVAGAVCFPIPFFVYLMHNKLSFLGKLLASIQLWRLQKPIETSKGLQSVINWKIFRVYSSMATYYGPWLPWRSPQHKKQSFSARPWWMKWSVSMASAFATVLTLCEKVGGESHWDGRYWNSVGNIDPMGILGNKRCVFTVEKAAPSSWKHVWNWKHKLAASFRWTNPCREHPDWGTLIILNHGSYGSIYAQEHVHTQRASIDM